MDVPAKVPMPPTPEAEAQKASPTVPPVVKVTHRSRTRADWFIVNVLALEVDVDQSVRELLVTEASMFLSTGGTISHDKWSMLSPTSKAIFVEAMNSLRS